MAFAALRSRGLQACSGVAIRAAIASTRTQPLAPTALAGARRLLSSPAPTGAPSSPTAAAKGQSQLHRGKKAEGEERRLWPYIKAARQQFFNVILATLSIVMAVKMVEGKGARVALEEEMVELQRRQAVLLKSLADEEWAEDFAKRIGAAGGKEAVMVEIEKVVAASLLDKETAQLEAMRAAALKTSLEQQKHGAPYSGGVGGAFADEQPRDASASPVATKPAPSPKSMM
ncbi:unnamed protein product [Ectocarpus fasciculatus]